MDSRFHFLSAAAIELLNDILNRRDPALCERARRSGILSASDAELIMAALSEELTNNLDEHWEPTDYGRTVSAVMAAFNRARIAEWP
ncbi:hypothetical protein A4X20_09865 [Mycolicibacterium iranicum]|uniref:Uncharacterized protein n=2 Tax=Mycolicibacterium iranicum TaxID=912594 RepID=A0A178LIF2_MYCIR|nr:hypothetical protein A4X20_09865 [Mycolicibacterium iranicum]